MRVLVRLVPRLGRGRRPRGRRAAAGSPAAVLAAGVVEVCNGAGAGRGRAPRPAPPRRPVALPRAGAARRQPGARRARLRDGADASVEDLRPGVAALRPGPARGARSGRLVRQRGQRRRHGLPRRSSRPGSATCGSGVADDLFTAEQAARTVAAAGLGGGGPGGVARASWRRCRSTCCWPTGRRGATRSACCDASACARSATSPRCPGEAVEARLGRYGASVWRRAHGQDPALFAARTVPPELDADGRLRAAARLGRGGHLQRPHDRRRRSWPGLAALQLVATGVRIEVESRGRLTSARTWLHPRFFTARDLVDRVHWQLQSAAVGGSLRARKDVRRGRARPVDLVRFVPDTVEPAAAHGEALWGGGSDDLVERGVARVQAMVGFDAVRRPVLQGGRSPAARQATRALGRAGGRPASARPALAGRVPGPSAGAGLRRPRWRPRWSTATGRSVAVTERGCGHRRADPLPRR